MNGGAANGSVLRLLLLSDGWRGVVDVAVTVRVFTGDGRVWRHDLALPPAPEAAPPAVPCPDGSYVVDATMAGGRRLHAQGEVRGEDRTVLLEPEAGDAVAGLSRLQATTQDAPTLRDVLGGNGRMRFWRREAGPGWSVAGVGADVAQREARRVVVAVRPGGEPVDVLLAELAGPKGEPGVFALVPSSGRPPGPAAAIVVEPGPRRPDGPPHIRVAGETGSSALGELSGFLADDDLGVLGRIGPSVARLAETVLGDGDGVLAAAGALVLLRARRLDLLGDWTRQLAASFPGLPDGAVIRAWHLLLTGKANGGGDDAPAAWLMAAADRGLPLFGTSLRLLLDGLRLHAAADARAGEALAALEPFRWNAVPGAVFTTFRGTSPDRPGRDPGGAAPQPGASWVVSWGNR